MRFPSGAYRAPIAQVANAKLVYLLYHEAREAVVDGRYPLDPDEYDYLAGLQALISNRGYNSNLHTPGFFKWVTLTRTDFASECKWSGTTKGVSVIVAVGLNEEKLTEKS